MDDKIITDTTTTGYFGEKGLGFMSHCCDAECFVYPDDTERAYRCSKCKRALVYA